MLMISIMNYVILSAEVLLRESFCSFSCAMHSRYCHDVCLSVRMPVGDGHAL